MSDNFFDEQSEQSHVKATIVAKYFPAYMAVIASAQKRYGGDRIAYIDLFAGPGRYKNGAKSTPVKIIEEAIGNPDFRDRLVALFNDRDEENIKSLERALQELPGYDTLRYKPKIYLGEVGEELVKRFEEMKLIPTLFFVDPWGYKGLSLRLINSVLRHWGCDCLFFFNYNRISMGLANDMVEKHMEALFGEKRAAAIRERFAQASMRPVEREAFIVEEMCEALKEMGGKYILPFRFRNERGTRITHHLIFVSKHFRGYEIMKEIMHTHSSMKNQDVATFEYNPADERQPMLFGLLRPLDELADMLMTDYRGRTLGMRDIYESHSVGKPFVIRNYREVLCKMEQDKRISVNPPCPPRRKGTMAEHAKITFPIYMDRL